MSRNYPILHLATGGTVDSEWDPVADTARPSSESFIPRYLQAIWIRNCLSEVLYMRDSREMGELYQQAVANRVAETSYKRVIISTGTYLMPDIARRVEAHPMARFYKEIDRRVVLMGARKPMKGYLKSDGGFNLGMSFALLEQEAMPQVSLTMSGCCYKPQDATKDLTVAGFTGIDQIPFNEFDLVTAGGTIDFIPDGMDRLIPAQESCVPGYLRKAVGMRRPFHALTPLIKDSRKLSSDDFQTILDIIQNSRTDHVLVTMGLLKIKELRQFLKENMPADHTKRIVITGSRLPLAISDVTDGTFNLGYAFGKMGFLGPGIHVILGGKVLKDDDEVLPVVYSPEEIAMIQR